MIHRTLTKDNIEAIKEQAPNFDEIFELLEKLKSKVSGNQKFIIETVIVTMEQAFLPLDL